MNARLDAAEAGSRGWLGEGCPVADVAHEIAFADGLCEAKLLVTLRDVCSASYFAMDACCHRSWAWRLARLGLHGDAAAEAARAAIYDEMADAKSRNDHAAVMAGFVRLKELTRD